MKISTLRKAISVALLVIATGTGEWVMAQDITKDATTQGRAPVTEASAKAQSKKSKDTASPPATTDLQSVTVTGTRIRGGSTPSPVITSHHDRQRADPAGRLRGPRRGHP